MASRIYTAAVVREAFLLPQFIRGTIATFAADALILRNASVRRGPTTGSRGGTVAWTRRSLPLTPTPTSWRVYASHPDTQWRVRSSWSRLPRRCLCCRLAEAAAPDPRRRKYWDIDSRLDINVIMQGWRFALGHQDLSQRVFLLIITFLAWLGKKKKIIVSGLHARHFRVPRQYFFILTMWYQNNRGIR